MILRRRQKGFSLTEMAIVLAVAGTLIGGIWLYAGQVMDNGKINALQNALTLTVTNVRSIYSGSSNMFDDPTTSMMQPFMNAQTIPSALIRNPATNCNNNGNACADSPFGWWSPDSATIDPNGTFQICGWNPNNWRCGTNSSTKTQFFGITVTGLKRGNCLQIATSTSGVGPIGLVDIVINGTSIVHTLAHALPISSSDANTYCNQGALQNRLTYVYRLRTPS